jgi:formylglycine-generating enzyme
MRAKYLYLIILPLVISCSMLIPSKSGQEKKTPIDGSVIEEPDPAIETNTRIPYSAKATQAQEGTFKNDYGIPMAWIPAGTFMMGSEDGNEDEKPIHEVYLDVYAIDVYEVTFEQYVEFLNEKGNQLEGVADYLDSFEGYYYPIYKSGGEWEFESGYADHPMSVSWSGALAYCEWRGGRLPTEAEWEKAARGGLVGKKYPWGDEKPTCSKGAENGAQYISCGGRTVPVGSFAPNGYGIYDMAGNVWEWVADWYQAYPGGVENEYYEEKYRVLRGGSWDAYPNSLRVAIRNGYYPDFAGISNGFRCAGSP